MSLNALAVAQLQLRGLAYAEIDDAHKGLLRCSRQLLQTGFSGPERISRKTTENRENKDRFRH